MLALLAWGAAAWSLDRFGHREASDSRHDAIIVLGCRVFASGQPSGSLTRRATLAARLYAREFAPLVVMTGGLGTAPRSEACVAADIAQAHGVPAEALLLEQESTSTAQNALFSARLLPNTSRVLVVTDAYHVFRAQRVFARHFDRAEAVGTVSSQPWLRAKGALREVVAVAGYGLSGKL